MTHRFDAKVTIVPLGDPDASGAPAFSRFDADGGADASADAGANADANAGADADADAGADAGASRTRATTRTPRPLRRSPRRTTCALAYEQGDGTATTPHGEPFAFESLAWAADGNVAWLPHELLANTHPFQFQTTLFPSVSVVDLQARAEVQTNPNDPNGVVAGRKNLFAAINILDGTGNTSILSQPCAAVMHPNGDVAYVLACASEDLLVFDVNAGIAIDLIRGLPGDHPVGIAMDDAGQRVFVLDDESADPADGGAPLRSKSLTVIDIAGGSLVAHAKVVGGPFALVAKDPVDGAMREGLRAFTRANSTKGTLATTGNFWMSCNGCHLDGFVTANTMFFEHMAPADPTKDALIGHTGLRDFFSKSPAPNAPADSPFDPHDALVAFEEMAASRRIAPERSATGRSDPSNPSSARRRSRSRSRRSSRATCRSARRGSCRARRSIRRPRATTRRGAASVTPPSTRPGRRARTRTPRSTR